jgi:uncharacterized membrane protein YfcA
VWSTLSLFVNPITSPTLAATLAGAKAMSFIETWTVAAPVDVVHVAPPVEPLAAGALAPGAALAAGAALGVVMFRKVNDAMFRHAVLTVLFVAGLALVV